jgi:plasmid maintenance system antidote protein VapI
MDFRGLHQRLRELLRDRITSGEVTVRGLARMTGVSQPHMHNVLKGKRLFSPTTADRILEHLQIDVLELLDPNDIRKP